MLIPKNNKFYIDIAVVGPVSSGKSTLTNTLFASQYSDSHAKKTTVFPQIYHEVCGGSAEIHEESEIHHRNKVRNARLLSMHAESKKKLSDSDIREINYFVPKMSNIMFGMCDERVNLRIHDMPGMNDENMSMYKKYTLKNFPQI